MLKRKFCLIFFVATQFVEIWTAATNYNLAIEPRIVNGTVADINLTGHQVSIRLRADEMELFGSGHGCGGSLISNNVVLTAAHCFLDESGKLSYVNATDYVVVMGNLNRYDRNEITVEFEISQVVKGNFNYLYDEDIALIFLAGKVPADHPTVKPIILNDGTLIPGTICQATGWGLTENNKYSAILRTVDQAVIDSDDCRNEANYGIRVREGMFCAGFLEGGRDACEGDSGGPLVCLGIQAGIISWGRGCGAPQKPSVFTNVSFYKTWILEQILKHNSSLPIFAPIPYKF